MPAVAGPHDPGVAPTGPLAAAMRDALARHAAGTLGTTALVAEVRALSRDAVETLPARYGEFLENVLARIESGAMFGEESCSFSLRDLFDALSTWADKADAARAAPRA